MGFDVVGTADDPVLYVASNDPRIDDYVDTNSGTLQEVRMGQDGAWERTDLVRGFPRSQHDRLTSGVEFVADAPELYVTVGGNTDAGATSQPLQYLP